MSSLTTGAAVAVTSKKGIIEIDTSAYVDPLVKYIEITLMNGSSVTRSAIYRFKIEDACDTFTLFFQNHLGDFDHFDFGSKVVKKVSTTNQRMEKPLPTTFTSIDSP